MGNEFQLKLSQISKKIPEVVKRIPGVAKTEGLRFIADNFKNEGFETKTGSYSKWDQKKLKGARKNTLIGEKRGGSLKRSWKGEPENTQVTFYSELPYAAVHNEGLQAGKPPGFTMPQRQMIGDSEALLGRIDAKLDSMVDEIFK